MPAEPTGNDCACFCAWENRSSTPVSPGRPVARTTYIRKRIIFSKRTDANSLVDVIYKTAALPLSFAQPLLALPGHALTGSSTGRRHLSAPGPSAVRFHSQTRRVLFRGLWGGATERGAVSASVLKHFGLSGCGSSVMVVMTCSPEMLPQLIHHPEPSAFLSPNAFPAHASLGCTGGR